MSSHHVRLRLISAAFAAALIAAIILCPNRSAKDLVPTAGFPIAWYVLVAAGILQSGDHIRTRVVVPLLALIGIIPLAALAREANGAAEWTCVGLGLLFWWYSLALLYAAIVHLQPPTTRTFRPLSWTAHFIPPRLLMLIGSALVVASGLVKHPSYVTEGWITSISWVSWNWPPAQLFRDYGGRVVYVAALVLALGTVLIVLAKTLEHLWVTHPAVEKVAATAIVIGAYTVADEFLGWQGLSMSATRAQAVLYFAWLFLLILVTLVTWRAPKSTRASASLLSSAVLFASPMFIFCAAMCPLLLGDRELRAVGVFYTGIPLVACGWLRTLAADEKEPATPLPRVEAMGAA